MGRYGAFRRAARPAAGPRTRGQCRSSGNRRGHRLRHGRGQGLGQGERSEHLVPVPRRALCGARRGTTASKVAPNQLGIEIEAALAFGTGHHGTTRGCLLLLDALCSKAHRPRRVLDLGTGTGVLGMAAAKALRIRLCSASDIDALVGEGGAGECAAERGGASGAGDPRHRFLGAGTRPARGRSIWCWRTSSPIRCGNWQHRWCGIWHHRRWSFCRVC